jgi:hypothetical protein
MGHLDDGPGQLESELFEGVRPCERPPGPGCKGCEGAERGKAVKTERAASAPGVVRESLEESGIELKGKTAVALTMGV